MRPDRELMGALVNTPAEEGVLARPLHEPDANLSRCRSSGVLQVGIAEGATRLERSKDVFREKVKSMLEAFLRELATMQEDFVHLQPTSKDGVSSTTALAFIAKWKGSVEAARNKVRGRCDEQYHTV